MKHIFLFGALIMAPLVARANDSAFEGVGGSLHPTRGENNAIRMVRETVVLTAGPGDDGYSTRADFVFANETGKAQTVSMGFPEGNYGDVSSDDLIRKSGFKQFATFVDDRQVAAKRTTLKKADKDGFDTYWVKTVSFAPRQTRRVRVEFRSPYGGTTEWGLTRALSYAFTGANWRGNVGESVLEVRVTRPGLWRTIAFGNNRKILPFTLTSDKKGATFRHVWKNWNAQENVTFGLEQTTPFWRKDLKGFGMGEDVLRSVRATKTVRVGAKPKGLEDSQGIPADAFTYNGTLYVGVNYLKDKLELWGDDIKPTYKVNLGFAQATGFDLRAGKTRLQGRKGDSVLLINGKAVKMAAPVIANRSYGSEMLYVPFAPLGRELGWKVALEGERFFSLQPGNWRG